MPQKKISQYKNKQMINEGRRCSTVCSSDEFGHLELNPGETDLLILIVSCRGQQKKNPVTVITIRIKVDFLQDKEALHQ